MMIDLTNSLYIMKMNDDENFPMEFREEKKWKEETRIRNGNEKRMRLKEYVSMEGGISARN